MVKFAVIFDQVYYNAGISRSFSSYFIVVISKIDSPF